MSSKYTEPDWTHAALIIIDMQNDFSLPGSPFEIKGTDKVIPEIAEMLKVCRQNNVPIVHVIRIYKEDGSNADNPRRELIEKGAAIAKPDSEGAGIVRELLLHEIKINFDDLLEGKIQNIGDNEFVIFKPRWGAFYKTRLEVFLKERGINTVVVAGCNFPNCPRTTIYEASERDFRIAAVENAISGVYERGLLELRNIGASVINAETFIDKINT